MKAAAAHIGAGTGRRGPACVALLVALAATAASPAPAEDAHASTSTCSSSGLRLSTATEELEVTDIRARGVACRAARALASRIATDELHGRAVPEKVDGFRIAIREPCGGCDPVVCVRGTRGSDLVTFSIVGL